MNLHIAKKLLFSTVSVLATTKVTLAYPQCKTDRPGWASHRTLYVPQSMLVSGEIDDAWIEVLCCVYTHVDVVEPNSINSGVLELYEGTRVDDFMADTFEELAKKVYESICKSQRGMNDCRNNEVCIHSFIPQVNFPPILPVHSCPSVRGNWVDHRNLYVPQGIMTGELVDDIWSNALCCVYTNVIIVSSTSSISTLEQYDGSTTHIWHDNFKDLANVVYNDICNNSYMGKIECHVNRSCVQSALSQLPAERQNIYPSSSPTAQIITNPPTRSSTPTSTNNPTLYNSLPPSNKPTSNPTIANSISPSMSHSLNPTQYISSSPTMPPSLKPSLKPSLRPTSSPSYFPSISPTYNPTSNPTTDPSSYPTSSPSTFPTYTPTKYRSQSPSQNPSIIPTTSPTPLCTADRPGWATHRMLYVPEAMIMGTTKETEWLNALCCLYTHVEMVPHPWTEPNTATLELYDGSKTHITRDTFEELALIVYYDICDTQIGSADCHSNQVCVYEALGLFVMNVPDVLPVCLSNRPGWADHRMLYVPETIVSGLPVEDAWADALCCVFTHVEVISSTSNKAYFEDYDGSSSEFYYLDSFEELASMVYRNICEMEMGKVECTERAICVENALAL